MSQSVRSLLFKHFGEAMVEYRDGLTVLTPETNDEAVRAVNFAREHALRLCPAGSMSHLDIAAGIERMAVLSSAKMGRVVKYSPGDLFLTIEAGERFSRLNSLIADKNLAFAFGDCGYSGTVGGAVALGLSGDMDTDIVHIKRWVISLSFVTPYGKHLRVGAVTLKSVAGYDITKLLVGSKGRLGFITSVTLRLVQKSMTEASSGMVFREPRAFKPVWDDDYSKCTPVERNLKENLDPDGVFPSL